MTAAVASASPVLDARQIVVRFGGVTACDHVTIRVDRGHLVGLTGPNGSGKSTFVNAVSGLVPASGQLAIDGTDVPLGRPRHIAGSGVARAFQTAQTWSALSCLENVLLGTDDRRGHGLLDAVVRRRAMREQERARWSAAHDALDQVGLGRHAGRSAGQLTYGERRMLELARTIMSRPRLLLLDEPAAGLNAAETDFLAGVLEQLRDRGTSVLVIDHKIDLLDRICDRLVVLELGKVIADAEPHEVWQDQAVIDAYLGSTRKDRGDG